MILLDYNNALHIKNLRSIGLLALYPMLAHSYVLIMQNNDLINAELTKLVCYKN